MHYENSDSSSFHRCKIFLSTVHKKIISTCSEISLMPCHVNCNMLAERCLLEGKHPRAFAADPLAAVPLPQTCGPALVFPPGCDWSLSPLSQGGCHCRLLSKPKLAGRIASCCCCWTCCCCCCTPRKKRTGVWRRCWEPKAASAQLMFASSHPTLIYGPPPYTGKQSPFINCSVFKRLGCIR